MILTLRDDKTDPLEHWLRQRIEKNRNAVILFSGNPGTGKTYDAISLGCWIGTLFGKPFSTDNWIFSITDLFDKMGKATASTATRDNMRGMAVLYEEVAEEQLAVRTNTRAAVSTTQMLATFRSLGIVLIMTSPRAGQLQMSLKSYCDIWLETTGINEHEKRGYAKIKFTKWDEVKNKATHFYPHIFTPNRDYFIRSLAFQKPPESLILAYEDHKLAFQNRIYTAKSELLKSGGKQKTSQLYAQKCPICAYEWSSRKQETSRCPRCFKGMRVPGGFKLEQDSGSGNQPIIS